jgi:transposase-like protein
MQEQKYKAMYKSEIARAAGVSPPIFRKWLKKKRG